jgi:hypothetical protein
MTWDPTFTKALKCKWWLMFPETLWQYRRVAHKDVVAQYPIGSLKPFLYGFASDSLHCHCSFGWQTQAMVFFLSPRSRGICNLLFVLPTVTSARVWKLSTFASVLIILQSFLWDQAETSISPETTLLLDLFPFPEPLPHSFTVFLRRPLFNKSSVPECSPQISLLGIHPKTYEY